MELYTATKIRLYYEVLSPLSISRVSSDIFFRNWLYKFSRFYSYSLENVRVFLTLQLAHLIDYSCSLMLFWFGGFLLVNCVILGIFFKESLCWFYQLILFFSHSIGSISTRFNIGLMLFASCFVSYMLRVNMSINILAMVHHQEVEVLGDDNITAIVEPNVSNKSEPNFTRRSVTINVFRYCLAWLVMIIISITANKRKWLLW